jgi:hypothetical protein
MGIGTIRGGDEASGGAMADACVVWAATSKANAEIDITSIPIEVRTDCRGAIVMYAEANRQSHLIGIERITTSPPLCGLRPAAGSPKSALPYGKIADSSRCSSESGR